MGADVYRLVARLVADRELGNLSLSFKLLSKP
jgi:hypothetical protein